MTMNRGLIVGRVEYASNAYVRLDRIDAGHVNKGLEYYNARSGALRNVGLHEIDKNGTFRIPFIWDPHNLGDFMSANFRVSAFDRQTNSKGSFSGKIVVGQDIMSMWGNAAGGMIGGGILRLAELGLASAFKTAFTPKLSSANKKALGLAVIPVL